MAGRTRHLGPPTPVPGRPSAPVYCLSPGAPTPGTGPGWSRGSSPRLLAEAGTARRAPARTRRWEKTRLGLGSGINRDGSGMGGPGSFSAIATQLVIELAGLGSPHWRWGFVGLRLDKAVDITIFVTGIVFVVWFRRARINAEHRGWPQRRARGWAFWGWIVPVVNLWFPFQIIGDIWRAAVPAGQRRGTAWLPALWWTTWLLGGIRPASAPGREYSWPYLSADTWTASLCVLAVSGLALIAIIRTVFDGPVGSPHPGSPAPLPAALAD